MVPADHEPSLITIGGAQRILDGVSSTYVRALADRGRLGPVRRTSHGVRLLERVAVERFASERAARKAAQP